MNFLYPLDFKTNCIRKDCKTTDIQLFFAKKKGRPWSLWIKQLTATSIYLFQQPPTRKQVSNRNLKGRIRALADSSENCCKSQTQYGGRLIGPAKHTLYSNCFPSIFHQELFEIESIDCSDHTGLIDDLERQGRYRVETQHTVRASEL